MRLFTGPSSAPLRDRLLWVLVIAGLRATTHSQDDFYARRSLSRHRSSK